MKPTEKGRQDHCARSPREMPSYPSDYPDASTDPDDFPEVPYDDPAWDDDDEWKLGPAIPDGAVFSDPSSGFRAVARRRDSLFPLACGGSIYSQDGEPYDQLPRSARGLLSRSAQTIYGFLCEISEGRSTVVMHDSDFAKRLGMSRRTIQGAMRALELLNLIERTRSDGIRYIRLAALRGKNT
jgi:hypothetical protein